jgi:ferritin
MISKKLETAINEQINAELYSAYLYLSMSAYFKSVNLNGFANWMRMQEQEEQIHAMKFFDYLSERGGRIILKEIKSPRSDWKNPLDVFENVYSHEQKVTGLINDLVDMAIEENDHATSNFLQWYVGEQVEEESSADEIVENLKLLDDSRNGLFMFDRELGKRTPAQTEE